MKTRMHRSSLRNWLRGSVAYWPGHFHASVFKCPTFQEMECPHHHKQVWDHDLYNFIWLQGFLIQVLKEPVKNPCLETRIGNEAGSEKFCSSSTRHKTGPAFCVFKPVHSTHPLPAFPSTLLCKENEVMLGMSQKPMQSLPILFSNDAVKSYWAPWSNV